MLPTITRTTISIRPSHALGAQILGQMWALYEPHHDMDHQQFQEKLASVDEVALFALRGSETLIGFCGLRHRVLELSTGRRVATCYMGLTYVRPEWRSKGLIQRVVIRRMLAPLISPRVHRVYFWADCLTYRPYLAMARNLREYYPSRTHVTSDEAAELIATLGRTYYGDSFDQKWGVVHKHERRIKQHEHRVSSADLQDPDIRFYMERNPDYGRGDGLIAICPMGLGNLVHLLGRQLRKMWSDSSTASPGVATPNGIPITHRSAASTKVYHVTDRLHDGRTVQVPADGIAATVSAWLAELGVRSPMVDDLARAVSADDWDTAHAVGECLSVEVTLAS